MMDFALGQKWGEEASETESAAAKSRNARAPNPPMADCRNARFEIWFSERIGLLDRDKVRVAENHMCDIGPCRFHVLACVTAEFTE